MNRLVYLTVFPFLLMVHAEPTVFLDWENPSIEMPNFEDEHSLFPSIQRSIQKVFLYFWRPAHYTSNFGDELSPKIVERIVGHPLSNDRSKQQFLALGSILHFAHDDTLVWGTGLNGKVDLSYHRFSRLDVRAVRGPLTRKFLLSRGIPCPEIYGDPALLMPLLFPELKPDPQVEYIIIPHLNEMETANGYSNVVLPIEDCMIIVKKILKAKFVVSSSLHGIIVAEAFGIPARLLRITDKEKILKYQDYYYATGRPSFKVAHSIEEALQMGGESPPIIDLKPLLDSFPYDKFN